MEAKTILVTGANRGIGFEISKQLARRGYTVVLAGRDRKKLEDAIQKIALPDMQILLLDAGDAGSIEHAAREFSTHKLKLDALINNAGILGRQDRALLQPDEVLPEVLAVNSLGPLRIARAFLPFFNKSARIVNISSGGGSMTDPVGGWAPAYCVSKTLLNAITRQLAYELEDRRIAVNAVCPGWVRTDMGGRSATRSVEKGAETPVWLAVDADSSLTGKFFRDKKVIPW
jgi:NAD(P)-dependent dehydrogenase (short-subunit alcohol dehydrogenase family)